MVLSGIRLGASSHPASGPGAERPYVRWRDLLKPKTQFLGIEALLALTSGVAILACSEWPPYKTEIIEYFHQYQEPIARLAREITSDQLGRVYAGELNGMVILDDPLPPDLLKKYRALFQEAGNNIINVVRDEDTIELLLWTRTDSDYFYVVELIRSDIPLKHPNCDEIGRGYRCGMCSLPIESSWYLYYRWWPEDLDSDLIRRIARNEISEGDYQAAQRQLLIDCYQKYRKNYQ